jgi:hypothetical protein
MDDKEKGRIWAEYYPRSGDNRNALQICGIICRLIRAETKLGFVISRAGRLQRILDSCGIPKADFDEVEKQSQRREAAGLSRARPPHS